MSTSKEEIAKCADPTAYLRAVGHLREIDGIVLCVVDHVSEDMFFKLCGVAEAAGKLKNDIDRFFVVSVAARIMAKRVREVQLEMGIHLFDKPLHELESVLCDLDVGACAKPEKE